MLTVLPAPRWFWSALLAVSLFGTQASAEPVIRLEPSEVEAYVAKAAGGALLAIHYTSDDGSCGYCETNNIRIRDAAAELGEAFDFAEVIWNPWTTVVEPPAPVVDYQKRIGYRLLGLPTIMVFQDGKPIAHIYGSKEDLTGELKALLGGNERVGGPKADHLVVQVPSSEISAIAKSMSTERPLFLTLSSPDPGCPPCIVGNANVAKAAPSHADGWAFAKIHYSPWRSFAEDPALKGYMAETGIPIEGLPWSLLIYKGKIVAKMSPMTDVDALLKRALPLVLSMDLPE